MAGRIWLATRMDMHDLRRRPLLLVLLVVTPVVFISRAISLTERIPRAIGLPGGGTTLTTMRDVHGAVMAAITVAFLGGLIGVFTMQAAKQADRRLVLAGFRGVETVVARLIVLFAATGVALVIALARDRARLHPAELVVVRARHRRPSRSPMPVSEPWPAPCSGESALPTSCCSSRCSTWESSRTRCSATAARPAGP